MCARHGRGAIEICLSEKGALAEKILGNMSYMKDKDTIILCKCHTENSKQSIGEN